MKKENDAATQILKEFSMFNTKPRLLVLNTFLKANAALDYSTLNKHIGNTIDRGTIYRTLYLFLEKGLLHTVPSADGIIHYVLRLNKDESKTHMHFVCNNCNKLIFLTDIPMPEIKVSKKLRVKNIDVVLNGICDDCDKKNL
ncbi:MAG TPA: transcriptional repressor [Parafilimonas sp.]|nr:transcriptional repressor [Parafilimonas sp.]